MILFGAHGGSIAGIQAGVENWANDGPMLGSYIRIEFYWQEGEIFVNWWYNNDTILISDCE